MSKSDEHHTLFGVGQGATDASTGWLLLSNILSHVYNQNAKVLLLHSPDKSIKTQWSHIMFVDDANLIHATDDNNAPIHEIRQLVQEYIQAWNEGPSK